MIAELISVGTELLMGQIVDTNAQYISQRLAEIGVNQYCRATVGDNHDRLYDTIQTALSRADLVILTGGLGPTEDDLTKETAADVMGKTLVEDPASKAALIERFARMGHAMTPNNLKQIMFPPDDIILPNPNGTAPGCIMEKDGKAIILMPGPPKEMVPMFRDQVMPYLEKRSNSRFYSHTLRIFGMGESTIEHTLRDMIDAQTNPTIATYALSGECTLRVTARCQSEAEGESIVMPVVNAIRERLGDVVYSIDNEPMEQVIAQALERSGKTLSAAESCTGGMLASTLVSVPGSSHWFLEGAVTYSEDAKIRRLGVRRETLAARTAVSAEVAAEMAEGMRKNAGTDYALATTGYAGPDGGTAEQPVGTVFVAFAHAGGTQVKELHLVGNRERIRMLSCLNAMNLARKFLQK